MYIVVAGGGIVGGQLARRMLENKHDVILIDPRKEVCDKLYAETGVVAVNGSNTNIEVLKEAGVTKADVVICATPHDADNLVCAILSKSLGVSNIIVRMRDPEYENAYREAGVNRIVRVTDLLVNQILMEIEHTKVRRIRTIGGGRANIFMVVVPQGAKVAGQSIKDISKNPDFPQECIFIATYNQEKEEFSIPKGAQVINEGDELFLISKAENIKAIADILTFQNVT